MISLLIDRSLVDDSNEIKISLKGIKKTVSDKPLHRALLAYQCHGMTPYSKFFLHSTEKQNLEFKPNQISQAILIKGIILHQNTQNTCQHETHDYFQRGLTAVVLAVIILILVRSRKPFFSGQRKTLLGFFNKTNWSNNMCSHYLWNFLSKLLFYKQPQMLW